MPQIPPLFFYIFGSLLIVLGGLRAYHLGWKQRPEGPEGELEEGGGEEAAERLRAEVDPEGEIQPVESRRRGGWARSGGGGHKRHIAMGLLWVALGIFLLVSTLMNARQ